MVRAVSILVLLAGVVFFFKGPLNLGGTQVRVVAYSSFVKDWAAGPILVKRFEKICQCRVKLIDGGDSGLLLQKVMMDTEPVDLVLGLDQWVLQLDINKEEWRTLTFPNSPTKRLPLEIEKIKNSFLAFDWSPLSFVYRMSVVSVPPKSLDDLLDPRFKGKISLQDPRTSNLGWQFLAWVIDEKGEKEGMEFLQQLKQNIFTVAPSWSVAYGLFQKGEVNVTFSYLTSLLYHWWEEKNITDYQIASFSGGQPAQVEYMGIPKSCRHCELAENFAKFLLDPESQQILVQKNYMLPIVDTDGIIGLDGLPKLKVRKSKSELTKSQKDKLLEQWKAIW